MFIGRDTPFHPSLSVAGVTYAWGAMSRHISRNARWMLQSTGRASVQAWSCASRAFLAGVGIVGGFRPPSVWGYVMTSLAADLAELEAKWDDDEMAQVIQEICG